MTTEPLDLDAITERCKEAGRAGPGWQAAAMRVTGEDVPALLARVAELEAALADRDATIRAIVDNGLHLDATGYRNAAADALMEISRLLEGGAS